MTDNSYLKTGFDSFDKQYGGLKKGHVILLGGRPCMGKSAFAISLVDNVCQREEGKCLYFSADMDLQVPKLCDRLVKVRVGSMLDDHDSDNEPLIPRMALNEVDKYNLVLMDAYFENNEHKTDMFLREARSDFFSLVIIDGIQKWFTNASNCLQKDKMLSFIRILNELAVELNCPILILSDLKRSADDNEDHRPCLEDICGIDDPLTVVDEVLLLFREEYYEFNSSKKEAAEITAISAQKQWIPGIELRFSHKNARFS